MLWFKFVFKTMSSNKPIFSGFCHDWLHGTEILKDVFHPRCPAVKSCGFSFSELDTKVCRFAIYGLTIENCGFAICGLAQVRIFGLWYQNEPNKLRMRFADIRKKFARPPLTLGLVHHRQAGKIRQRGREEKILHLYVSPFLRAVQ